MAVSTKIERIPRRANACMVPRRLPDGFVQVDSTWALCSRSTRTRCAHDRRARAP